ncbi:MAG TPA: hypothetical protein DEG09_11565 [Marinilabiliaceae bacterium]|nr:hypothetical protein [Marinilabiliaceae bacterium]
MWKDLLTLTRGEQRGMAILLVVLFLLILLRINMHHFYPTADFSAIVSDSLIASQLESFPGDVAATSAPQLHNLEPFNPNEPDPEQLRSFGVPANIASNWVKYIQAGGSFKVADDLRKLYGMSEELLEILIPYVDIPQKSSPEARRQFTPAFVDLNRCDSLELASFGWTGQMMDSVMLWRLDSWFPTRYSEHILVDWNMDSIAALRLSMQKKYKSKDGYRDVIIAVNSADAEEWKLLKGIGEVLSERIVAYRNLLGGFVSIDQVAEVYGISPVLFGDIKSQLRLDSVPLRQIKVNYASVAKLRKHPYFDFYSASELVNTRRQKGYFTSLEEIDSLKLFDDERWGLLRQYLEID